MKDRVLQSQLLHLYRRMSPGHIPVKNISLGKAVDQLLKTAANTPLLISNPSQALPLTAGQ
ncbi:hypothetical protein [Dyadobacter frigoris]|uniref:Uncharacterized protein n=1 Tax=Dyadobacter frigoris TaxID=2576211 RepID=A0A4U6CLH3_9BACT|nr:hypothetical protein [Dyadobacter frigoris]TKT84876.1 hypothetical protein FDK13_34685 [Dyadobacter frigoris]GLU57390.1 hypothetical protein Dfri01_68510 [Dyadobacter frigoris]